MYTYTSTSVCVYTHIHVGLTRQILTYKRNIYICIYIYIDQRRHPSPSAAQKMSCICFI